MRTLRANRLNAFVVGDADAIGEVLLSPLGEPASGDADGVCLRARGGASRRLDAGPRLDA